MEYDGGDVSGLQWWRPILLWECTLWFAVFIVEGIRCNIKIKPLNHTETRDEIDEEISLNCKIVPRAGSNFHFTITIYFGFGFVDDKQEITLLYCLVFDRLVKLWCPLVIHLSAS